MTNKFRGQDIKTKEWVYGSYVKLKHRHFVVNSSDTEIIWKRVKEETVGQYIGLDDCDKKEIASGDLVKHRDTTGKPGEVHYEDGMFKIGGVPANTYHSSVKKIVGTIHDNKVK